MEEEAPCQASLLIDKDDVEHFLIIIIKTSFEMPHVSLRMSLYSIKAEFNHVIHESGEISAIG